MYRGPHLDANDRGTRPGEILVKKTVDLDHQTHHRPRGVWTNRALEIG